MENKNPGRHADASLPATAATQKSRRQPDKLKYEVRRGKYEERKNPEYKIQQKPGGHSLMAPPGPIPNPEVKHQHVDGSRTTGPARVDSCQGKQAPDSKESGAYLFSGGKEIHSLAERTYLPAEPGTYLAGRRTYLSPQGR